MDLTPQSATTADLLRANMINQSLCPLTLSSTGVMAYSHCTGTGAGLVQKRDWHSRKQ